MWNFNTFIYIIGIPIGILGWFAAPYILEFMKVPQDVWNAALSTRGLYS